MAYWGKPDVSAPESFPAISNVKFKDYTFRKNSTGDKPSEPAKEMSLKSFNSGTPCISTAFTPIGKPSAIKVQLSTVKDCAKCKHFSPEILPNDLKYLHSKNIKPKKELNSGTSCTSKAFTPLGKSAANTAKNTANAKDFNYEKSNTIINDFRPFNPKSSTLDKIHQNTMKYYTSSDKSTAICTAESTDFIPRRPINDSMLSSTEDVTSKTIHEITMKNYTPMRKSFAVNTEKPGDFSLEKATNGYRPLNIESYTTRRNTTPCYQPSTEKPKDLPIEKNDKDSKSVRFSDTTSRTVISSNITKKYYIPRSKSYDSRRPSEGYRDFKFGSENTQDPGSSDFLTKNHRSHNPSSVDLLRCIICIEKERDTVFQPCGHLIVCSNCAKDVKPVCPMCRKRIKKKIKAYIT